MWLPTVVVSCLVSCTISLADLEDSIIPEDYLQDLTARTKKSPVTSYGLKNEPVSEIDSLLKEDIRRKIGELKHLNNAYEKVEAVFFPDSLKYSQGNEDPREVSSEVKDDLVRNIRDYYHANPLYNDNFNNNYRDEQFKRLGSTHSGNLYTSGTKHESVHGKTYKEEEHHFLAQPNSQARTFNIHGQLDENFLHKLPELLVPVKNPETPQAIHTTNVSPTKPTEQKPVQPYQMHTAQLHPVPAVQHHLIPEVQPHPLPAVQPHPVPAVQPVVHPHQPIVHPSNPANTEGGNKHPTSSAPGATFHPSRPSHTGTSPSALLFYEKKEIGGPHGYFSKQIVFGPHASDVDHNIYSQQPAFNPHQYDSYKTYYNPLSYYPQGYLYDYYYQHAPVNYMQPAGRDYAVLADNYFYPGKGLYLDPTIYSSYSDQRPMFVSVPQQKPYTPLSYPMFNSRSSDPSNFNFKRASTDAIDVLKAAIEAETMRIRSLEGKVDNIVHPQQPEADEKQGSAQAVLNTLQDVSSDLYSQWTELKKEYLKKYYGDVSSTSFDQSAN